MCSYVSSFFVVPSPPVDISLGDVNSTSVQIFWSQPALPNGVLLHYTLSYFSTHDKNQEQHVQVQIMHSSTTHYMYLLTGLLEDTEYEIVVTASTRIGEGLKTGVLVRTYPGIATPPMSVSVEPVSSSEVQVSWSYPAIPRGRIRGYIVTYRRLSKNQTQMLNFTLDRLNDTARQKRVISDLQTLTCYIFQVAAYAISERDSNFQVYLGITSQPALIGCTFDKGTHVLYWNVICMVKNASLSGYT